MANLDQPFGFRPVQTRDGSPWCGKTRAVIIAAADTDAFFIGDMVKFTGDAIKHEIDGKFYERVELAIGGPGAAAENLAGAVTGILAHQDPNLLFTGYRPAGAQATNIIVEIPQDRNVVYVVQEDSVGGALTLGAAGANINFNPNTGNPATRTSGAEIDSSTVAATSTHQFRLLSPDGSIDNEIGVNALWYVTVNTDPYSDRSGIAV